VTRIVEVSWHAIQQFQSRWPNEAVAEPLLHLIATEVEDALDEGRYSTKEPRWSRDDRNRGLRNGKELDRTLRFAWTEDQRRLYLVDKRGQTVRVVTSIRPGGDKLPE
jgi:hypothetical protein